MLENNNNTKVKFLSCGIATSLLLNTVLGVSVYVKSVDLEDYKSQLQISNEELKTQKGSIVLLETEQKKLLESLKREAELREAMKSEITSLQGLMDATQKDLAKTQKELKDTQGKVSNMNAPSPMASRSIEPQMTSDAVQKTIRVEATMYTNCPSENGGTYGGKVLTASGYDITNATTYNGMKIIAADTRVIPLNTIVNVQPDGLPAFKAIVLDRGGAIKGNKIDVLTHKKNQSEMYNFGRRGATITIL